LLQFKDKLGTVLCCQLVQNQLKEISRVETEQSGFTTFDCCFLMDQDSQHIIFVTQASESPNMPKLWMLSEDCQSLDQSILIDASSSLPKEKEKPKFGKSTTKVTAKTDKLEKTMG
jgi:hypothetical protein